MDRSWMRKRLEDYLVQLDLYMLAWGPNRVRNPESEEIASDLRRREPTVKEILKRLDPQLAKFRFEELVGDLFIRANIERGLGILEDQEEWVVRLAPDAPSIPADQFHPWVWEPARPLWSSPNYRQAVQAAATSITAHTRTKLGRDDLSDTQLMQSALTTSPKAGVPRLVANTDGLSQETAKGFQQGVLSFAVGSFLAIRNPATHEHNANWDEQLALEYLASLSVLARWIHDAKVETL